jgi:EPS-associated MarR family transcriptional regulator
MTDPENLHYYLLQQLAADPVTSQRELARRLGVSVGKVNYCLQALVEQGLVKAGNFYRSEHKTGYAYLLTPEGLREKAAIGRRFLQRKLAEYEALSVAIEQLKAEVGP